MPSGGGGATGTAKWAYSNTGSAYLNSASHIGAWEMWFKTSASTLGMLSAISTSQTTGTGNCNTGIDQAVYISSGKINFKVWNGSTATLITSGGSTTYNDGAWHHLVINWSSAGGLAAYPSGSSAYTNMYIDNTIVASSTTAISYSAITSTYYAIIGGGEFHPGSGGPSAQCGWAPSGFTNTNRYSMFDDSLDEVHYYNGNTVSTTMLSQRYNAKKCRSTTNFNSSPANTKYHDIVVTFDNSTKTAKLYVDKNLECTQTYSGADIRPTGSSLFLGGHLGGSASGRYWSGYMTDFKLYDAVLDSTSIGTLYDSLSPRHP